MLVRSLAEIEGTDADIQSDTWRSKRIILAKEGVGFSVHETTLYEGTSQIQKLIIGRHATGINALIPE